MILDSKFMSFCWGSHDVDQVGVDLQVGVDPTSEQAGTFSGRSFEMWTPGVKGDHGRSVWNAELVLK